LFNEHEQSEREQMKTNDLVETYIRIRGKREEIKKEADKQIAALDEDLEIISLYLSDFLKDSGASSIKTPHGTAYTTVKSRFWTNNWEAMYNFIQNHGVFDLLEKRIHQSNMKTYLEENPDQLPEGLNVDSKHSVIIRRK